jgi:hypothetical protein
LCWATSLVLVVCPAEFWAAESRHESNAQQAQIQHWIRQLNDENYPAREAATAHLIAAGRTAIGSVGAALRSESPEIAWRCSRVLEQIGLASDEQALAEVCRVLDQIENAELATDSKFSLARPAGELQARWRQLRHERAAREIRRLGGKLTEVAPDSQMVFGGFGGFDGLGGVAVGFAVVDPDWDVAVEELPADDAHAVGPMPAGPRDEPADDVDGAPPDEPEMLDVQELAEKLQAADAELQRIANDKSVPAEVDQLIIEPPLDLIDAPQDAEVLEHPAVIDVPRPGDVAVINIDDDLADDAGDPVLVHGAAAPVGIQRVHLDRSWKGAAQDIGLLKELSNLNTLEISDIELSEQTIARIAELPNLKQLCIRNSHFERQTVERLKQAKPDLQVLAFGNAMLGISGTADGDAFLVSRIVPDSGADRAGIRSDDVIHRLDGEAVSGFESLTLLLANKHVGEAVELELVRGGKTMRFRVTLSARQNEPQ